MHIVFAGGDAPGHWFAGLTVAHQIRAANRQARITFLGSGKDFESRNATLSGFQYRALRAGSPAGGWGRTWRYLTDDLAAHRAARRLFKRDRPDCVVAMGGPASLPAVRASLGMSVPVVMLEYDALPDPVTQAHADRAAVVFAGFAAVREHLDAAAPVRVVGNPIRAAFAHVFRRRQKTRFAGIAIDRRPRLMVLAGATGDGRALNESVPKALYKLRDHLNEWSIIHQAGSRDVAATRALYHKLGLTADVTAFVPDMPRVLLRSHLAIARPGAITLSELAAATLPVVVVPSAKSGERRQSANAAAFAAAGACRVVEPSDDARRLDDRLSDALADLLTDADARRELSSAIGKLARPEAAWHVASAVLEHAQSKSLQHVA